MKVEAPFIHLIKLHTKYYLYDVNSKMIVNISNDLFDFFKSNENIKAEIEIPHKLEDEVRRLLKYDLFSKTDTGYEIEYPQGTNLEEILNNCMRIMTLQVTQNWNLPIDFPPILIFSRNFRCQMPNPYVLPLFLPLPAETRANSLLPDYHIQQLR